MSLPSQQRALLLPAAGLDKTFELGTREVPQVGPGQVLVRNITVALNPVDWIVHVMDILIPSYPAVVGYDAAGIVTKLGEGVTNFAAGDKVYVSRLRER